VLKILDRYILKQFLLTLIFSLVALYFIFLIVDLLENLNNFLDNNMPALMIIEYYIYFFPQILKILTPVAMLLSTLFTIGRLSTSNEITAMKTGGMSLYRLMFPLLITSILISFGHLYFNGWIVPLANQNKMEIERVNLQKSGKSTSLYNFYFRDTPNKHFIMDYYNPVNMSGNNVAIEIYDDLESPRLISRMDMKQIIWDTLTNNWIGINVVRREFKEDEILTQRLDSLVLELNLKRKHIERFKKTINEMNLDEYADYLKMQKSGGKNVRTEMTEYYGQWAYPFANIIVVIFGVPFASIRKKGGIAVQIGAALVISFTYLVFTKVSQTIGNSADIEPWITGWAANMIFFVLGIVNIIRTRS